MNTEINFQKECSNQCKKKKNTTKKPTQENKRLSKNISNLLISA